MKRENEEEKERKGMRVLRCGFFGTASTMNLCSKFYRDCQMREEQTATAMADVEKSMTSAPSSPAPAKIAVLEKAVEKLFAYHTVNKLLSPKSGEQSKIPIPASLIAGACAGVSSTLCTYPLELVKTRLTIQRGVYTGIVDAFVKILQAEGFGELYRGLGPSVIGVIPYVATNYFSYDTLRKAYKKVFKKDKIANSR